MKISTLVALAILTALAVPGTVPAETVRPGGATEVDSLQAILAALQADMARLQTQLDSLQAAAPAVAGDAAAEETGALGEAVGVEVDVEERARYGLFSNVEGFLSAVYLKRSDGSYVVRLVYTDEAGNEVERTNKVAPVGIEFVRAKIAAAE